MNLDAKELSAESLKSNIDAVEYSLSRPDVIGWVYVAKGLLCHILWLQAKLAAAAAKVKAWELVIPRLGGCTCDLCLQDEIDSWAINAAKTEVKASPDPYDPVEVLRESGERLTKIYPDALVIEVPIPEKAARGGKP